MLALCSNRSSSSSPRPFHGSTIDDIIQEGIHHRSCTRWTKPSGCPVPVPVHPCSQRCKPKCTTSTYTFQVLSAPVRGFESKLRARRIRSDPVCSHGSVGWGEKSKAVEDGKAESAELVGTSESNGRSSTPYCQFAR